MTTKTILTTALALSLGLAACGDDGGGTVDPARADAGADAAGTSAATGEILFVVEREQLVAFDLSTGKGRPGAIANVRGATDMRALPGGPLVVNLTDANEILFVDPVGFRELARVRASSRGATRPVHGYVTPAIGGRQLWAANNDGDGTAATNSLVLVDVVPTSGTYLKAVGEIALGVGHHKNAWSPSKARVSVSNIADCGAVVQVIDYADPAAPRLVKSWSAAELDPARPCTPMQGVAPHGAAAAANGRGYHALTGWGAILSVDQDADAPTFKLLPTKGSGAGYTRAGQDGRYVYSLQRTPREGDEARPGVDCQIGQLVVVDATADAISAEVPILLDGPACAAKLAAPVRLAGPDHVAITPDGKTMLVTTQATAPMGSADPAWSDRLVVFDLTDPARPAQRASIVVGKHGGHRALALSPDGRAAAVANGVDKSVSHVDVAAGGVVRTIALQDAPRQLVVTAPAR